MAVLDIRGTHGSGKSWIMHRLLSKYKHEPIQEDGEHLGYYLLDFDAALLGRYTTACGGCDGIKTADEVVRRVRLFSKQYTHVLLEGILVSHTFKRYSTLAQELSAYGYLFLFLNTPLKTCIGRVRARRHRKGNMKLFNTANLKKDWHQIWGRTRSKCLTKGHKVIVLDWKDSLPRVLKELKNAVG